MTEEKIKISLNINNKRYEGLGTARTHLADFMRNELGLTGTHVGCEHGVCGACTVLVDGQTARGCLMLAVQAQGMEITTIEGLSPDPELDFHPIQQAFHECHGLQCGFCTPGILMTVKELLEHDPDPDRETILRVLSGHLCRCTGYQNIIKAVERAAELMRAEGNDDEV